MAHIIERKRKDGSIAYLAQIDIKRNGKRIHREARTFDRKSIANAWMKKRLREISTAGDDLTALKSKGRTLGDAIRKYTTESIKEIGRTKAQVLTTILEFDIADMVCEDIKSPDIVEFARDLSNSRTPATVGNYMSHLSAVFVIAKPAWGLALDPQAMKDGFMVCNRLGITGKSKARNRRPSLEELDALMDLFELKHLARPKSIPMHRVLTFALFSTRRQEEITRIEWSEGNPPRN